MGRPEVVRPRSGGVRPIVCNEERIVAEKIAKGVRVVGGRRDALGTELAERYTAGESIRATASSASTGDVVLVIMM